MHGTIVMCECPFRNLKTKVLKEVTQTFNVYESALCNNDVQARGVCHCLKFEMSCPIVTLTCLQVLDGLFFDNDSTVRFGTAENLYGYKVVCRA